jgi:hypothetical protein
MLGAQHLVLAACLGLGLLIYERYGLRLGGVLVLPLVTAYALFDPRILLGFFLGSMATYGLGELVVRRTLIYGRRLLYVYILGGLFLTAAALHVLGVEMTGIALVVLPGIFAFNLHREGAPVRRLTTFASILAPIYLVAHLALYPVGFEGGLFQVFPGFELIVADVVHFLPRLDPIGTASASPVTASALDGTGMGGVLGSLIGGEAE